jgi:hypothetical protein
MNSGSLLMLWRCLIPELWRVLLMVLVCCSALSAGLYLSTHIQDTSAQWFHLATWMIAVFLWWLAIASRACNLVYSMLPLRLPGCYRVALTAVTLQLSLSIVLPLMLLLLFDSQANIALFSGALLLSAALALWVLSLPNALWFLPMLLLFSTRYWSWLPQTAWEFWGLALLLLAVTSLLWAWYSRAVTSGNWWLKPTCVLLETPAFLRQEAEPFGFKATRAAENLDKQLPHLANILGPGLQGPSQLYGWRGRLATLVFLLVCILLMSQAELSSSLKIAFMYGLVSLCVFLAIQPTAWLREAQTHRGPSLLANLHLLPGLPSDDQLLRAFCKQVIRGQAEKLALLASTFIPVGIIHGINPPLLWVQWLFFWLILMLPFSLLSVLLACRFTTNWWRWLLSGLLIATSIATSHMLLHGNGTYYEWLVALWLSITAAILIATGWVYRSLQQRGIPYFS